VKSGVDNMSVGTIFESRDATFFEDIFPMRYIPSMSCWESDLITKQETPMEFAEESDRESSVSGEDNNEAPTRSKRQRTAKSFVNDFIVYLVDDTLMSMNASILVDNVGPPSAEACRTAASFPLVDHPRFIRLREEEIKGIPLKQPCS
jgi:hypothetical protein